MNNENPHNSSLKDTLLKKIESNELAMKPRLYFTLRLAVIALVAALVLAVTVFIFNFIFFTLRVSGQGEFARQGGAGVLMFLRLFPWLLLLADVVLLAMLEKLLRKFRFAYRQPVLYIFLILLAFTISLGLFIDRVSDVNERLLHQADEDRLPGVFNDLYRTVRRLPSSE